MVDRQQPVEAWARTAEFPQPVRWGDIEAAILSRPPPEAAGGRDYVPTGKERVGGKVAFGIVMAAGILMYGLPVIGLGIVWAVVGAGLESGWLSLAQAIFFVSLTVPLATLSVWWSSDRRREPKDLIITAVAGCSALAAHVLIQAAGNVGGGLLEIVTLLGAVCGFAVFAVLLLASNAGRRRSGSRTGNSQPREDRYNVARARVLDILVERGVVDEDEVDIGYMLDMPLGTWRDLDTPR